MVSINAGGVPGNALSTDPDVSDDGRFVVFRSSASNLAVGDTNNINDVYRKDMTSGQIDWVSELPTGGGGQFGGGAPSISSDGRFVSFDTSDAYSPLDTNAASDIYVRDMQSGLVAQASLTYLNGQPNGDSYRAAMSGDGRLTAFISLATNLIPNDANGGHPTLGLDVFVRDLNANTTELVHVSSVGIQGNSSADRFSISFDGLFVAFRSSATNLVPGDSNGVSDIFVRDRTLGVTSRVNVSSLGVEANNSSQWPFISSDGRFVTFTSRASNLVPNDNNGNTGIFIDDVFLHDRQMSQTDLITLSTAGVQANASSSFPSVSDGGRYVVFKSQADNLIPTDLNNHSNLFQRDTLVGTTRQIDLSDAGAAGNAATSSEPFEMTRAGDVVVFGSTATNLVPHSNSWMDVFAVRPSDQSPRIYCTSATTAQGCVPAIDWNGTPSAAAGTGFDVSLANAESGRFGTLLYGVTGPSAIQSLGGTLCVGSIPRRTPLFRTIGSSPCGGTASVDFNVWISNGLDPTLVASQGVWAQFWTRDPHSIDTLSLSDALFFVLEL